MNLVEILKEHSEELGEGVDKSLVSDLEERLDIVIPIDFKEYLIHMDQECILMMVELSVILFFRL